MPAPDLPPVAVTMPPLIVILKASPNAPPPIPAPELPPVAIIVPPWIVIFAVSL